MAAAQRWEAWAAPVFELWKGCGEGILTSLDPDLPTPFPLPKCPPSCAAILKCGCIPALQMLGVPKWELCFRQKGGSGVTFHFHHFPFTQGSLGHWAAVI